MTAYPICNNNNNNYSVDYIDRSFQRWSTHAHIAVSDSDDTIIVELHNMIINIMWGIIIISYNKNINCVFVYLQSCGCDIIII